MKNLSWLVCALALLLAQLAPASAFRFHAGQRRSCPLQVVGQGKSCSLQAVGRRRSSSLQAVAAPEAPAKKDVKKDTDEFDSDSEQEKERGWLVRLFNDPMNKREFVARCLMEVCGLGDGQAYSVMMGAHQSGVSVIVNCHKELAELYRARLLNEGLLVDMIPADDED